MISENPIPQNGTSGSIDREDSPIERERAYHAFITAINQRFDEFPGTRVHHDSTVESINLEPTDPSEESIIIVRPIPGVKRKDRINPITSPLLNIKYPNGNRRIYSYTDDRIVVRWDLDEEKSGASPEPTKGASADETMFRAQQMIDYSDAYFANLRLAQQMGQNGQPVSAPETKRAVAIIRTR